MIDLLLASILIMYKETLHIVRNKNVKFGS